MIKHTRYPIMSFIGRNVVLEIVGGSEYVKAGS